MNIKYTLKKPSNFIFDHLSDMQNFVDVHPVIYKIEPLGENKYLIYEKIKKGFVSHSFTYTALVESDKEKKTVAFKVAINKMVKIEMLFNIVEENSTSVVHETILFKSIFPVKLFMGNFFKKQHELLFSNIEQKGIL